MIKRWILQVTGTKKPPYRTKVAIRTSWLADMGFVNGAPVWAIPQQDGFALALRDEYAGNEKGKLIHVGFERIRPALTLNFAKNFTIPGLVAGDFLVAECEYGFIKARKLPHAQQYHMVGCHNYDALLRLCGYWLNDAGFLLDTVVTVAVVDDCIVIRTWNDAAATYADIVKFARARKYQIIQPRALRGYPIMDIPTYILNRVGFREGDIFGVRYDYGLITLFKPVLQ